MAEQIYFSLNFVLEQWHYWVIPSVGVIIFALGVAAAVHALFNKRDPRAALGWTAICLGMPGFGPLFYLLFGVNRIESRAKGWQDMGRWQSSKLLHQWDYDNLILSSQVPFPKDSFRSLVNVSEAISELPLVGGCSVEMLRNGEAAYPKMISAIENAKKWVFLCSYIFDSNKIGMRFVKALVDAKNRGVEVKVLVDGFGVRTSKPRVSKLLKKQGVDCALFLPPNLSPRSIHFNLRTHRKIMVVDGEIGFTGGMNIGDRHMVYDPENKNITQDIHFCFKGSIVAQLQDGFFTDWYFATNQPASSEYFFEPRDFGEAYCRGVMDGPNETREKIKLMMIGAINTARHRIRIMTPYFIPDRDMISALNIAVMRGVEVEIILPEKNNLAYIQWASQSFFSELLEINLKIYYQPPPFAHSKVFLMDDFYSLIGSANVDPRSLRLNFEFNVEIYDYSLSAQLNEHFSEVIAKSKRIEKIDWEGRKFWAQLRDSFLKLFSPYL